MFKTILVLSENAPEVEATLAFAAELGRRLAAHIDVLNILPDPRHLIPPGFSGLPAPMIEEIKKMAERAAEERIASARAIYDRLFEAADIPASWQVAIGEEPEIAPAAGRLRDLIVIGRPGTPDDATWRATLNAVLFNSGRPILLLPRKPPPLGDRVAVAWNGSAQAAWAVAAALPVLRLVTRAKILSAGPVEPHASTAGLIASLARHGIVATAREFEPSYVPIGQALLAQCHDLKANLLVMGAYGHSRVREFILGGATHEILAAADLPVLMAH